MRLFVLLIVMSSLLFSFEAKVILGSYTKIDNAKHALVRVKYISRKDTTLQNLVTTNKLKFQITPIENYYTVTISNFANSLQLFHTMKAYTKYYKDLYALPYNSAIFKIRIIKKIAKHKKIALRKERHTFKELQEE